LDYLTTLLNETAEETRRISHNLSPMVLEKYSLSEAIILFVQRLKLKDDQTPKIYTSIGNLPSNLPIILSVSIYRIVQELVQNAIKHARAQSINILLNSHQDKVLLIVEDDGVGLPQDWENNPRGGIGLKNVKTRVSLLGGNIVIQTGLRKGTSILIEAPLLQNNSS
ncbi:MAG: ATP-binding protein, partial [Bacteroidia bacterium]|nr:ATP-binding protein [Bacteroidia bacterium]